MDSTTALIGARYDNWMQELQDQLAKLRLRAAGMSTTTKENSVTIDEGTTMTNEHDEAMPRTIEEAVETIDRLQTRLDSLADGSGNLLEDWTAQRVQITDLTTERDDLQSALHRVANERADGARMLADTIASRDEVLAHSVRLTERINILINERDDLQATTERLANRLTNLVAERDSLETRLSQVDSNTINTLRAELANAVQELVTFKESVKEIATRYAQRHDWCGVVNEALEEMGLAPEPITYIGTVTITVDFQAELEPEFREVPSRGWVRDNLDLLSLRGAIENNFGMDEGHESSSVESITFTVTNLRSAE